MSHNITFNSNLVNSQVQTDLASSGERADLTEQALARSKLRARSASVTRLVIFSK